MFTKLQIKYKNMFKYNKIKQKKDQKNINTPLGT